MGLEHIQVHVGVCSTGFVVVFWFHPSFYSYRVAGQHYAVLHQKTWTSITVMRSVEYSDNSIFVS